MWTIDDIEAQDFDPRPRCTRCGETLSPDSAVIHEHGVLCDSCSYRETGGVPIEVDGDETTPLPFEPMVAVVGGRLR